VVGYFKQELPDAEFQRLVSTPPPNKTASLIDLIQQARQRTHVKK
jgi:hypothetical protein